MRANRFLAAILLSSLPVWSQPAAHEASTVPPLSKGEGDVLTLLIALSGAPLLPLLPGKQSNSQPTPPAHATQEEDPGQRVFEQNCARCHNAPEGFPASITGTIVRHMRVRASLSEEEEKELLHFFNP
jgi:mono/diheme cytochrome c family protein